jgi:hypothetical protein
MKTDSQRHRQYTPEEEKIFNNYVRQFRDRYRVRRGEDGIWEIPCIYGDIEPYSLTELCCYQEFKSAKGINNLKRKLPGYCTFTQEGSSEIVFRFPNERLDEIAKIVKARTPRKLSPEQRNRNLENLKAYRFKKVAQPARDTASVKPEAAREELSTITRT